MIRSADGTILIESGGGVKTVLIPSKNDKMAVCVSTQIGCGMNCAFCRAGKFERNMTSDEIVEQVREAAKIAVPTSLVVMGMGEPMLNFKNVSSAIGTVNREFGIPFKRMTLSTSGVFLDKLVDVPYQVAVSLHHTYDKKRQEMMPGTASVQEVVEFSEKCRKGVMIEYALIAGVNDSDEDLERLLSLDWADDTNFNLIEFNDYNGLKKSTRLQEFKKRIMDAGYKCFIRESRGSDIQAACGMLSQE